MQTNRKTMKTATFTLALSLLTAGVIISQPVINSNSFYEPGDYILSYDVDAGEIADGPDGENKLWDFSQITPTQQSESWSGSVVDPATVDDFEFFGNANVALQLPNGSNRYWRNDASGLVAMGQGGDQSLLEMTDPNAWLTYPFTYGSSTNDNASGTIYSTCRDYEWSSTSETEGVGYGTLILPDGTYENVLKVRRISFTSKVNEEIGLERENNIVEHFWYQPGTHGPLLYMRTWNNNGCPGSNSGSEIIYTVPTDVATDVQELSTEDFSIDLFPNPARDITHLGIRSLDTQDVEIWISDLMGKSVLRIDSQREWKNNRVHSINLKSLSPGLYVVNIKTDHSHQSQRLVIQ